MARLRWLSTFGYRQKGWSHVLTIASAAGAVICALQAVRACRLLPAAIWLAGVSALTSLRLYSFGTREVAVVELSVGAGLVIILFVFAMSLAGEPSQDGGAVVLAAAVLVIGVWPGLMQGLVQPASAVLLAATGH